MRTLYRFTFFLSTLFTALLLTGCSPTGNLPATLNVISEACAAATVAIPIIEASGVVQTGIGNIVLAYTSAVSTAASESSAELLTTDTAAQKATKITGYFASVAVPALGPTIGPEVQTLVQAISAAVNLFLSQFNSASALKAIQSGAADHLKLSAGDRHALGGLHNKLAALAVKAKGLIKP
jgi:hypothetical protein